VRYPIFPFAVQALVGSMCLLAPNVLLKSSHRVAAALTPQVHASLMSLHRQQAVLPLATKSAAAR
jgi:hypothetical protein